MRMRSRTMFMQGNLGNLEECSNLIGFQGKPLKTFDYRGGGAGASGAELSAP